jgi:diguanylate cyclase (GGDEF)-like protein
MANSRTLNLISGSGSPAQRLYNAGCIIAMLFCSLSALESYFTRLSLILVAANVLYSLILAFLYYLSRIKLKHRTSRTLGIALLIFLYTPVLWIFNGGSTSSIPYFVVMFTSFLVVFTIDENPSRRDHLLSVSAFTANLAVVVGLIFFEYYWPEGMSRYPNRGTQYFDMASGMVFAVLGNYFILRTFVVQHHDDLREIRSYSQRLEELTTIDSMTGLTNHTHVIERLDDEARKALRYNRPLSMMMFDLDHFKQINDRNGHQLGDEVLMAVASTLKTRSRKVDIAARYGGDEFLLVLPETNTTQALVFAKRLQSELAALALSFPVGITISGGIVKCSAGDSARVMIKRADEMLYKAKAEGRNRVLAESSSVPA